MNAPGRAAFAVCILAAWAGMAAAPGHAAIDYAARRERREGDADDAASSHPHLAPGACAREGRRAWQDE